MKIKVRQRDPRQTAADGIQRNIPAMMVASASPLMPLLATIPATIVAKAAVGPAICTVLPPRNEMIKPAIIAV